VNNKEKQQLIRELRDLRDRMEAPKPAHVDALSHYAELCGRAIAVLDSALITLST
jgi:hypothetical protein